MDLWNNGIVTKRRRSQQCKNNSTYMRFCFTFPHMQVENLTTFVHRSRTIFTSSFGCLSGNGDIQLFLHFLLIESWDPFFHCNNCDAHCTATFALQQLQCNNNNAIIKAKLFLHMLCFCQTAFLSLSAGLGQFVLKGQACHWTAEELIHNISAASPTPVYFDSCPACYFQRCPLLPLTFYKLRPPGCMHCLEARKQTL